MQQERQFEEKRRISSAAQMLLFIVSSLSFDLQGEYISDRCTIIPIISPAT